MDFKRFVVACCYRAASPPFPIKGPLPLVLFSMHGAAIYAAATLVVAPPSAAHLLAAATSYSLLTFGITAGHHRYFSHRAFRTSRPFQFALGLLGSCAWQRGPIWWSSHHTYHHNHSDTDLDPHSPITGSALWAHMGCRADARTRPGAPGPFPFAPRPFVAHRAGEGDPSLGAFPPPWRFPAPLALSRPLGAFPPPWRFPLRWPLSRARVLPRAHACSLARSRCWAPAYVAISPWLAVSPARARPRSQLVLGLGGARPACREARGGLARLPRAGHPRQAPLLPRAPRRLLHLQLRRRRGRAVGLCGARRGLLEWNLLDRVALPWAVGRRDAAV